MSTAQASNSASNCGNSFIRQLSKLLELQKIDCNIGVSECLQGVETLQPSFLEAMEALQIGKRVHPDRHIFEYDDDILYHTLSNSISVPHVKDYYLNALLPLIDFDRQNDVSLFKTLEMYFKCGFSIKDTAEALYIHRNTMASRLEKIKELLPYDLSDFNDCAILLLSFHTYDLLKK